MHSSSFKLKSAKNILEKGSKAQNTRPIRVEPKSIDHILKSSSEIASNKELKKRFSEDKLSKKRRNLLMKAGSYILKQHGKSIYNPQLEKKKLKIDDKGHGGGGGEIGSSVSS
ncbi:hypothetical protein FXO38_25068 [Capsicum annuum]|nr:hypothetical protein FXO37_35718 [Capsicum annuum]KAF3634547.1 hypothetical protein FXO38_25068 [Capsicum annuum]